MKDPNFYLQLMDEAKKLFGLTETATYEELMEKINEFAEAYKQEKVKTSDKEDIISGGITRNNNR